MRPFTIDVPEADLADLQYRLANTRWAPEPEGDLTGYGVPRGWIEELVDYWRDGYDWRSWEVLRGLDRDTLLTHVTAYWLTRTATSAVRICAEYQRQIASDKPTTAPLALAQFPDDLRWIRAYAERDHANIVSWTVHDRGGHYAAHQATDLLVQDIRTFYDM